MLSEKRMQGIGYGDFSGRRIVLEGGINNRSRTAGWISSWPSPSIGLVGPMSNYAAPPQLIETVPYRIGPFKGKAAAGGPVDPLVRTDAVNAFARSLREQHPGKWAETNRLGGFCLLIKREVLAKVGPLEGSAGLGLFDTDLLCHRARQAGFKLACCKDLFIHHFGSRTFAHGAPAPEVPA